MIKKNFAALTALMIVIAMPIAAHADDEGISTSEVPTPEVQIVEIMETEQEVQAADVITEEIEETEAEVADLPVENTEEAEDATVEEPITEEPESLIQEEETVAAETTKTSEDEALKRLRAATKAGKNTVYLLDLNISFTDELCASLCESSITVKVETLVFVKRHGLLETVDIIYGDEHAGGGKAAVKAAKSVRTVQAAVVSEADKQEEQTPVCSIADADQPEAPAPAEGNSLPLEPLGALNLLAVLAVAVKISKVIL